MLLISNDYVKYTRTKYLNSKVGVNSCLSLNIPEKIFYDLTYLEKVNAC